jgi:hypothetical protein
MLEVSQVSDSADTNQTTLVRTMVKLTVPFRGILFKKYIYIFITLCKYLNIENHTKSSLNLNFKFNQGPSDTADSRSFSNNFVNTNNYQNRLSPLIRGPGAGDSRKKVKKISRHCTFPSAG